MIAFYVRAKYYVGWTMAQAAVCASGQSYNGEIEDPKTHEKVHLFDRFFGIDALGVETSVFSSAVTEGWNHNAHMWLKRCIYFRMNRIINRDLALYLTYVISAFWHGFYPFYFAVFILYAVTTENHKDIHKLFTKHKFLRNPLCYFIVLYSCC